MNKFSIPALALFASLAVPGIAQAQTAQHAQPVVAASHPAAGPPQSDSEVQAAPPTDKGAPPAAGPGTPETTETEILATQGASFASKDRIAVFTGDVRVTDPKFQLACDKLTVFLSKSTSYVPKGASAARTPSATPAPLDAADSPPGPGASPTPGNSGGIDHAVAEGHVVIVQERAAAPGSEAKRSVGRGDWALFDNKSGDMTLKGTPSVEQNENTHVATSPNTVMTLRKDNSLTTVGPSRTVIMQRKSSEVPGEGSGASPAPGAQGAPTGQATHQGRKRAASPPASPASTNTARS